MKITLITPTPPDISAFGVRGLASYLREAGHHTQIIFLPGGIEDLSHDTEYIYQYPAHIIKQIVELCRDSQLIGLSFMTLYFDRAVQVTNLLKKELKTPIVWGGIHPTLKPEEALQYADIVCLGEGEEALAELADKMEQDKDYHQIKNLWFAGNDHRNPSRPEIKDLDQLPYWDFKLDDHYIYHRDKDAVVGMNDELLARYLPRLADLDDKLLVAYRTMSSRGCPHRCSYCASSAQGNLRRRSVEHVIEELVLIRQRFPFIGLINFFDDTFFAASEEYFRQLAISYKEKIGLPFYAQCSPTTISKKKMDYLVDAGLIFTEMGIQTGSDRIKKMYRRTVSNQKILEAAKLIAQYQDRMRTPDYHIILDNPWETSEDTLETLKVIIDLPRPFGLCISSLILFPGTELYHKAKAEKLIKDEINEIYRKPFLEPKGNYLNYLIYLAGDCHAPSWLLRLLSRPFLVKLFQRETHSPVYELLYHITRQIRLVFKGIYALLTGDFERIIVHLRRVR